MEQGATDLALLVLRAALGVVMLAHGWNHVFGGGRIEGTASWFEGLGMRPARLHAWLASMVELAAGALLVVGLLTSVAAAAVVGVLVVAWVANHRTAGFFVFRRPTEGWEYVMTLTLVAVAVAILGPGGWSVDALAGLVEPLHGWVGLGIAAGGAVFGGITLAAFWRPGSAS